MDFKRQKFECMNRKLFPFAVAVIFLFVAIALFNSSSADKVWPKRIRSRTKYPLKMLLNPHVSEISVLTIDGKRFENVRGFKPFYLRVPATNMIVFVSDEKDYSVVFHVFNMDTDEDISIRASSISSFGREIGSSSSFACDSVEKMDGGQIILCNDDKDAKSTLLSLSTLYEVKSLVFIDLGKRALVADKTIYYDKDGKILDQREAKVP
jgi:hypothetical protein